jgi:ABC-type Na+ efflux pump permease subunit
MKAIWTFLCLTSAAVFSILAFLFVPESARTDKFWLALGAVGFANFVVWLAFTFRGPRRGQQAGDLASGTISTSSLCYFLVTLALGGVAIAPVSFKVLLALHIVALFAFVLVAGMAAIGARALETTREANRPE